MRKLPDSGYVRPMKREVNQNLFAIADAFSKATGKSLSQIGKEFYGRGDFFPQLKAGHQTITISRADEMLDKFRREWPADAKWPMTAPVLMSQSATSSSR